MSEVQGEAGSLAKDERQAAREVPKVWRTSGKIALRARDPIQRLGLVCNRLRRQGRKAAEKAEKDTAASTTPADDKKSDKSDKKTKESSPAKKTSEKASASKVPKGD